MGPSGENITPNITLTCLCLRFFSSTPFSRTTSLSSFFYQVQHMRRNLDQSEAAIIQVFEEKQRVWERQMDELRQNYASRLQQVTSRLGLLKAKIRPKQN